MLYIYTERINGLKTITLYLRGSQLYLQFLLLYMQGECVLN